MKFPKMDNSNSSNYPSLEADKMFFDADKKIKDGLVPEALELLNGIIEKYPEYGRAYNHIGFLYETKYRDYKTAEQYYQKALQYAPEYPATYLNYAALLSTIEKFQELEELLKRGLQVPGISKEKIYNEFGIMFELQERYEEAIESYKKAIRFSLNEQDINIYKKSIERCKSKEDLYFM